MEKFHYPKIFGQVFIFLFCIQVYSVSPVNTEINASKKAIKVIFDLSPHAINYSYRNNKKIETPVFEYNPRRDVIRNLEGAGFRIISDNNKNYDLTLKIEYEEGEVLGGAGQFIYATASFNFTLKDKNGMNILKLTHGQRNLPSETKNYVTKRLSGMIKGRLQAADEVSFLISKLKQGISLRSPVKMELVRSNSPLLKRLQELNDARTKDIFLAFLRSYSWDQRSTARSALLKLGYRPPKGSLDEATFEMAKTGGLNPDRKLREIIITLGSPAIERIIEDIKCLYITGQSAYGGGLTGMNSLEKVLKVLTEEKMSPFLQRTIRNKQGRFVKEKRKWKQEWNDTAVTKLIEVITNEHKEHDSFKKPKSTFQNKNFYDLAIDVLGEIADKRAIETIRGYLAAHPESKTAKKAIKKIGEPQAFEQYITDLNSGEKEVREIAASALGKIGDPRAIEPLVAALNDTHIFVRRNAVRALGKIDDPRVIDLLIDALKNHRDEDTRMNVASVLGIMGNPRAVEPLIATMKNRFSSWNIKASAARALGITGDTRALEPLINASGTVIREPAQEALKEMQEKLGIEPFLTLLRNKDPKVRKKTAIALDYQGWHPENDNQKVTYYIARDWWDACLKMDKKAVEPLITYLYHESSSIRESAVEILGKIEDPLVIDALIAALSDEDSSVRLRAISGLIKINDPRTIEPMITVMEDKSGKIREVAVEALGKINDPRIIEPMIAALKDEDRDVKIVAARTLGKISDLRAIEPLILALSDSSYGVPKEAMIALRKITKQKFGVDQKKWKRWWKKNKKKYKLAETSKPSSLS